MDRRTHKTTLFIGAASLHKNLCQDQANQQRPKSCLFFQMFLKIHARSRRLIWINKGSFFGEHEGKLAKDSIYTSILGYFRANFGNILEKKYFIVLENMLI